MLRRDPHPMWNLAAPTIALAIVVYCGVTDQSPSVDVSAALGLSLTLVGMWTTLRLALVRAGERPRTKVTRWLDWAAPVITGTGLGIAISRAVAATTSDLVWILPSVAFTGVVAATLIAEHRARAG